MQIKRQNISDTEVKLTVEADKAFLGKAKDYTLTKLRTNVKVPGFREGKAPLAMVEKAIDATRLQQEFLEEAVNSLYVQVLQAEKLRPVTDPKISLKKFVPYDVLEFEIEVEAIGEIKLANYKIIKKAKPKVEVSAKDVNEVVKALQKRLAERKEVERPAKNGDELLIDFKGVDKDKKAVNGAEGQDYPLVLGSGTFIPGFEPELVGLKAGQSKTFAVTFPKDYGVKALANQQVTFTVTVKKVQELVEPAADDKFAAQAGPFKTLAELKADIKKQVGLERQAEADRQFQNEVVQTIADKSTVVIPKVLVDEQISRGEQEERQNLAYKGQTWEEHLKEEGVTEEQHRERNRESATQAVKASIVMGEIAEREKLEVTPEELEIRIQLLKGQYKDQAMQAELDKPENRQDIANRLLTEKTLAKLMEYADQKAN